MHHSLRVCVCVCLKFDLNRVAAAAAVAPEEAKTVARCRLVENLFHFSRAPGSPFFGFYCFGVRGPGTLTSRVLSALFEVGKPPRPASSATQPRWPRATKHRLMTTATTTHTDTLSKRPWHSVVFGAPSSQPTTANHHRR